MGQSGEQVPFLRQGRFCVECGAALLKACPSCGSTIQEGEKFCGECGAALDGPLVPSQIKTSPAPAASATGG